MGAKAVSEYGKTIATIFGMAPFWLLFRWAHNVLVFSDVSTLNIAPEFAIYLTAIATTLFGLIILFGARKLIPTLLTKRYLTVVCCCIGSILNLLILFELPGAIGTFIIVLRIIFTALSLLCLTILWGLITVQEPGGRRYIIIALSFALSFLLYNLEDAPGLIGMLLPIIAPAFSALCQLFCRIEVKTGFGYRKTSTEVSKDFFAVIIAFVLATGLMRWVLYKEVLTFIPQETSLLFINTVSMLVALLILFVIYKVKRFEWASYLIWIVCTLICFAGLLLMVIPGDSMADLGGSIVLMSRANFGFLLFALFVSYSSKSSSYAVGGLFAAYAVIDSITNILSFVVIPEILKALNIEFSEHTAAVSMLVILFVIGISFVFFAQSTFKYLAKDTRDGEEIGASEQKALDFAEETTLSAREKEITILLYQGYTYKKIAEVMFISPNTVTTHIKSIYRKLDVHSKQDLIDRINSDSSMP